MTRCLSIVAVLPLLIVSSPRVASASDQSPSDNIRRGMTVEITDDTGKLTEGRVESISDDVIRIARRNHIEEVSLPRIVRIEKPDHLRNGTINGLIVGATVTTVALVATDANVNRSPGVIAWALVGNSLLYAGIGTGIDWMIHGRRTLYERGERRDRQTRIAPIVGPGVAGGMLRVSW